MKLFKISLIYLLFIGSTFSETKLLSLVEADRVLTFSENVTDDLFLCQMEPKKKFGKNPAINTECFSLKEESLKNVLATILQVEKSEEFMLGFYSPDGKQLFPSWEENTHLYSLVSFVVRPNSNLFVQALKKENKAYYFWRTKSADWNLFK
ncbi:MAG: hypothetical protein SH817_04850 [Leptospira sp.]|nr:hypothetical protein [Leptospira sp.]